MKLYFLIPVFNEEQNLELLFENLSFSLKEYERIYVFVDDASTDRSVDLIKKLFCKTQYHIILKEKNIGPGDSFNKGFEWILANYSDNKDIIVTIEADNTSDPSILSKMIALSQLGYDLVLASVYAQGGGFEETSFFRKAISFWANILFRTFYNVKVLTLSSFFRVYKIELIKKIKFNNSIIIKESGFISMLEILLKVIKIHGSIIEVPMVLKSSLRKGKSKMKIMKTTWSYIKFMIKIKIKTS